MEGMCRQPNMQFQTWNRIAVSARVSTPCIRLAANELQFDSIIRVITHPLARTHTHTASPATPLSTLAFYLHWNPFSVNLFISITRKVFGSVCEYLCRGVSLSLSLSVPLTRSPCNPFDLFLVSIFISFSLLIHLFIVRRRRLRFSFSLCSHLTFRRLIGFGVNSSS